MRLNIALRNLVISQIIILLFLGFAYFIWFPHAFLELGGFTRTAVMLIFADLILGPLLVFIIFKEGKKYLKFDINVLLGIQIIAFLFGAYSLYLKHPAYAVFKHDRFILTNVSHLYPQPGLQEQLTQTVFSRPQLVSTKLPENITERMNLMVNVDLFGAPDIEKRPALFQPLSHGLATIHDKSIDPERLLSDKNNRQKIDRFLKKYGGNINQYMFFPITGNNKKLLVLAFDKRTSKMLSIIDINAHALMHKRRIQASNPGKSEIL